jgi:hypothetical protein
MLIFRECRALIGPPITLTHTCRRWRQIAVSDASLWTNINIHTRRRGRNARLDHFISFLGMQLDRTADLLLDVEWNAEIGGTFFAATVQLIRQKAPFSRWRTLDIYLSGGSHENAPWSSVDAFTNLEVLLNWHGTDIVCIIDRTITSRLKVLDLRFSSTSVPAITSSFPKSLAHISTLRLFELHVPPDTPFPSKNVINLQLERSEQHSFPHIRTYQLRICEFYVRSRADLRSMTTLIVTESLTIRSNCQILLPALRQLKLGSLGMSIGATLEAPLLDCLHFANHCIPGFHLFELEPSNTREASLHPGYLLSPNTSIFIGASFRIRSLIEILASSPKVTYATLQFDDWEDALAVLERLVRFGPEVNPQSVGVKGLCPRLSELRLDFDWKFSEPSASKDWLLDALKTRKKANGIGPLSIFVGWKGEGSYVLLSSG